MDKLKYLISFAIKKRIQSKSFLISNIVVFLAIVLLTNITTIIEFFGGDFDDVRTVYVIDETNEVYDSFVQGMETITQMTCDGCYSFEMGTEIDEEDAQENDSIFITIKLDPDSIYHLDVTTFDGVGQTFKIPLNTVMNQLKLMKWANVNNVENIHEVFEPVKIEHTLLDEDSQDSESKALFSSVASFISMPVFFLMIMAIQFLGMDIIDEKATKSIEIIVSNVSIVYHFISKIVSSFVFLLLQAILGLIYLAIGLVILTLTKFRAFDFSSLKDSVIESAPSNIDVSIINDFLGRVPVAIIVMIGFLLVGYVFYGIICAVIASMSNSMEDYQQMQGPMMMILVLAFYSSLFSQFFEGSIFIKILGYIPIFSPMLAPTLFLGETFSLVEILISLAILLISITIVMKYGLKLYKTSILNYSDEKFFKRLKKVVKMSKQQ